MNKLILTAVSVAGLLVAAAGAAQARSCSDGNDRWMTVRNYSGQTAVTIRIKPAGTNWSWSGDLLGSRVIGPNRSLDVKFDDGSCACRVHIRVTGRPWYFTRNVCVDSQLTLD